MAHRAAPIGPSDPEGEGPYRRVLCARTAGRVRCQCPSDPVTPAREWWAMGRIEHTLLDEGRASSPPDLRPSPAPPPYHTKLRMFLSMTEDRDTPRHGAELRRISLPRTPVNRPHSCLT
jgi:hypothetical protein